MNKLSMEYFESLVSSIDYYRDGTLTLAAVKLSNGATVVGKSNVIDPKNYDPNLGRTAARTDALSQLWELEGYACKTRGFPE